MNKIKALAQQLWAGFLYNAWHDWAVVGKYLFFFDKNTPRSSDTPPPPPSSPKIQSHPDSVKKIKKNTKQENRQIHTHTCWRTEQTGFTAQCIVNQALQLANEILTPTVLCRWGSMYMQTNCTGGTCNNKFPSYVRCLLLWCLFFFFYIYWNVQTECRC